MFKFRKLLPASLLFIGLSAMSLPVLADNEIPTRHFGTPHHSMMYTMRADNDMAVQNIPQKHKADCSARFANICWAQKLPPKAN